MTKLVPLGFVWLCSLLVHLDAQDANHIILAQARSIKDMSQLDLRETTTDQRYLSAICRVEAEEVEQAAPPPDQSGKNIQPADQDRIVILGPFAVGKIIVLNVLSGSQIFDSSISYKIDLAGTIMGGHGEDQAVFSPFDSEGSYVCLLRLPVNSISSSLTQYPQTFLVSPRFLSQIKRFSVKDLDEQLRSFQHGSAKPRIIAQLAKEDNQVVLAMCMRSWVGKYPTISSKQINSLLSVMDKETVGALIMYQLLAFGGNETSKRLASALCSQLSKSTTNSILLRNISLALLAFDANSPLPQDGYSKLRAALVGKLKLIHGSIAQ